MNATEPEKPLTIGRTWHFLILSPFREAAAISVSSDVPSATPPTKHVTDGDPSTLLLPSRRAAWISISHCPWLEGLSEASPDKEPLVLRAMGSSPVKAGVGSGDADSAALFPATRSCGPGSGSTVCKSPTAVDYAEAGWSISTAGTGAAHGDTESAFSSALTDFFPLAPFGVCG